MSTSPELRIKSIHKIDTYTHGTRRYAHNSVNREVR